MSEESNTQKTTLIKLESKLHRKLKSTAALSEMTMNELITKIIDDAISSEKIYLDLS